MRLTKEFYRQPATKAAPELLGRLICFHGRKYRITETECYFGTKDTACHAHKGRTKRTEPLFHEGGIVYIYICYGIHHMFNVVTGKEGHPEGVLVRAVEEYEGPGKLCKEIGITRELHEEDLTASDSIWIEDDGYHPEYIATPRIGIDYASEDDIQRPWRFVIKPD